MQIGDINVVHSILNLERQVSLLTMILEEVRIKNPNLIFPNSQKIEKMNNEAIKELAHKYPNMDIKKK